MSSARSLPALESRETLPGSEPPRLPADLPGYRLERVIGRGGMGVVYEATQLTLNRRVAVKLLAPELAGDATLRARFRREALLQATLDHPHVLEVYEAGACPAGAFIVMRLVRGETLRARLRRGPLSPRAALDLLAPVADALDAAHRRGLVHRDVKPENILIGGGRHAYLADFGLVRALGHDALTRPGITVGTLGYVPPEQLQGAEPSIAGDVYALAAVLRDCVGAGALDDVLSRGLAYEPQARPQSAGELMRLCGLALRAVPGSPARPSTPRRGRARIAASCLIALASLGWGLAHHGRPPLGARVADPMVTEMTGWDWRRDGPSRRAPVAARGLGVAIQANVRVQGSGRPLQVVCELRDLDTGVASRVGRVVAIDAATIAPSCWIPGAPIRGHHYRATMWLWPLGAAEPLAAGSTTFVGGGGSRIEP